MGAKGKNFGETVVLVGTYRREQLERWILPKGFYNYPVGDGDDSIRAAAQNVRELWLYAGRKDKLCFSAKLDREVTAEELDAFGYPRDRAKPHSDRYLLFKVEPCEEGASNAEAPRRRVLVRLADFKRSATNLDEIRSALADLKAAKDAKAAGASSSNAPHPLASLDYLPSDLVEDWGEDLCVCEGAEQLEFWEELFGDTGDTMPQLCKAIGCKPNMPGWPDIFGARIKLLHSAYGNRPIRTLSLFSGAGGLDIGFADAGFDIVESVEIEEKFCETLKMNSGPGRRFEKSKVNCIDIRKFSPDHLGKIDFIIGGPPCQTFSAAGRRANGVLGTTDARGILFREYVRLLRELSPRGFLFENVYGITGAQNGEAWREIQAAFREAGYNLFFRILDAADYGVPQHRERLIIVGLKEGAFRFPRPTHGPDSLDRMPFYNAATAVDGVPLTPEEAKPGLGGRFGHLLPAIPPGLNYSFYTEKLGHPNPVFAWRSKFSDFLYKADPSAPVRTIKASGGAYTGPLHWGNRFFALGEYKRLQTFPDDYRISGGKQVAVKQIGNSVPPQLARILALSIQVQVFNARYPFRLSLLDPGEALSFRKHKADLTREYQGKAAEALSSAESSEKKSLSDTSYYCSLSDSFKFAKEPASRAEFLVSFDSGKGLSVRDGVGEGRLCDHATVRIHVRPGDDGWIIRADKIDIDIFSPKEKAFTVGWKAFEQLIADNNVKADLVQLNGYYQYDPKLKCSCEFFGDFRFNGIVSSIVSGRDVAHILPTSQLASDWGVSEDEVWEIAEFLRSLGYEIRNANTNPQIPANHWLVPYAFPTFSQRSVQFRKKLR